MLLLLLWPLRDILPWDFQYLGLIFALNCVLQLYFGYRISWLLAGHSRLIAIAGALLFLVAPPFVFRSSGHFPLTSHWLILAALILYFTSSAAPTKWRLAAGAALCFLAATIHAYIIVMVLLIDTGAHLRAAMSSKEVAGASLGARLYWIGLRVGISLASAIAGLIIFGLLRPLELRAYAEGGYGAFSMNLLAPIDPGNFGALVLKPQPQVGILQYEGYNYLGLGVILLGTLALGRRPSEGGKLLGRGWSIPESWGRWSDGDEAVLILRFADVSRGADFHLSLAPFVMPGHDQRVEVSANGNAVARWRFTTPDAQDVSFHIPAAYVRPDGIVSLTFSLPDASSPRSFGLSADARQLAFRLIGVRINLE